MAGDLEYYGIAPSEQREVEFRVTQTATGGQTTFTGLTYKVGYLDGWRDGVKMDETEFTATDGTTATLVTACIAGEKLHWQARRQVPISDAYTKTESAALANNYFGVASGTGNAALVTTTPLTGFAYSDGAEVRVRWPGVNSVTTPTVNVNSLGVKTITDKEGNPVQIGSLTNGQELVLRYNSTTGFFRALDVTQANFPRSSALTQLLYPSADGGWRDIYRAGWRPSFFNQQWGGGQYGVEMVDNATGTLYKFEAVTGNVQDDQFINISDTSARTYTGEAWKAPETQTIAAIWIKIYKIGNPTNNLTLRILPDSGSGTVPTGNTPITNGTATAQSGKIHTSKADGEWYRFVFPTPPSVTANTTYHVVLSSSGAVDASNYWVWKKTVSSKYPFSAQSNGDGTPTWSLNSASHAQCFLVEPAVQILQTGGQFDGKLVFSENNPINHSKNLVQPLRNFFDGKNFTSLIRIKSAEKGKPVFDFLRGLDHDRIQVMCNSTTGYASVNFYDSNRTLVTLTSAVDISTASFSDVAIVGRFVGDGADYLQLWVNGILTASTTGQTYVLSQYLRDLGTAWVGGGLPLAPVWTQDLQMTSLPSAQSFTYSVAGGSPTEANTFSIQNGKLFQNKNGVSSGDAAYYTRTGLSLNNTTGWTVEWKSRVSSSSGSGPTGPGGAEVQVYDGTKSITITLHENVVHSNRGGTSVSVLGDFKYRDHVFTLHGKGSNYWLFIDGLLAVDGTGQLSQTTATNGISFGDITATAGENADVIWHYLKYYVGGTVFPQASTGMSLHEFAFWSGNKSSALPVLYGAGTPFSVKDFADVLLNYVNYVPSVIRKTTITGNTSTGSSTPVVVPDMEAYFLGDTMSVIGQVNVYMNSQNDVILYGYVDGAEIKIYSRITVIGSNLEGYVSLIDTEKYPLGMHKIELRWQTTGGAVVNSLNRQLKVYGDIL